MPLLPGVDVDLTIEKPAAGGRMIARHAGQVVLVSGAIPGERVRVRIERVGRGVAYGMARQILQADPDRRGPADERPCGGMVYAHIAYPRQLELKAAILADAMTRIGRIQLEAPVPVEASPEQGYRMRARLHPASGRLGFYREGTHDLCDPALTGQLLPETVERVSRLAQAMRESGSVGPTAVDLSENIPASERAIHLEFDGVVSRRDVEWAAVGGLTGVTFGTPRGGTTTLVGEPGVTDVIEVLAAPGEKAGGAAGGGGRPPANETREAASPPGRPAPAVRASAVLWRRATAFFQANRYLLPTLLARVVAHAGGGPVVDLYAGVGLFSVALAAVGGEHLVAVEGDPASAADLRRNAAPYGPAVSVYAMPVERYLGERWPAAGSTVIVDPPRTGMTREAVNGILAWRAPRIVYVSCDVATLARDAGRLVGAGYALEHLEAFDLFPNTAHVEVVGVFRSR